MWFKKKNEADYPVYEADEGYYHDTDSDWDDIVSDYEQKPRKSKKRKQKSYQQPEYYAFGEEENYETKKKPSRIFLFLGIAYAVFLGIGYFSTPFIPNESGIKEAHVITLQLHEERRVYNDLRNHYLTLRDFISQIEQLDRIREQDTENPFALSTKYADLLPLIEKKEHLPGAKALRVPEKYKGLKDLSVSIYDNIAIYLQKMRDALAQDNKLTYEQALSYRVVIRQEFEQLHTNLSEFARLVKIDDEEFSTGFFR